MTARAATVTNINSVDFHYDTLKEAFPEVDPGLEPLGACVLVQIRHPKARTAGGTIIPDETRATEYYNTQVAKVIALGPMCFKSTRETDIGGNPVDVLVDWPGGPWYRAGNYVRVPKYGGDRYSRRITHKVVEYDPTKRRDVETEVKEEVIFVIFKAKDILGRIPDEHVLTTKSFLD